LQEVMDMVGARHKKLFVRRFNPWHKEDRTGQPTQALCATCPFYAARCCKGAGNTDEVLKLASVPGKNQENFRQGRRHMIKKMVAGDLVFDQNKVLGTEATISDTNSYQGLDIYDFQIWKREDGKPNPDPENSPWYYELHPEELKKADKNKFNPHTHGGIRYIGTFVPATQYIPLPGCKRVEARSGVEVKKTTTVDQSSLGSSEQVQATFERLRQATHMDCVMKGEGESVAELHALGQQDPDDLDFEAAMMGGGRCECMRTTWHPPARQSLQEYGVWRRQRVVLFASPGFDPREA
jgi:hypothetical protein